MPLPALRPPTDNLYKFLAIFGLALVILIPNQRQELVDTLTYQSLPDDAASVDATIAEWKSGTGSATRLFAGSTRRRHRLRYEEDYHAR